MAEEDYLLQMQKILQKENYEGLESFMNALEKMTESKNCFHQKFLERFQDTIRESRKSREAYPLESEKLKMEIIKSNQETESFLAKLKVSEAESVINIAEIDETIRVAEETSRFLVFKKIITFFLVQKLEEEEARSSKICSI